MNGMLLCTLILFLIGIVFYILFITKIKKIKEHQNKKSDCYIHKFLFWFNHLYLTIVNFSFTITTLVLYTLIQTWPEQSDGHPIAYAYIAIWCIGFVSYIIYFIIAFITVEISIVVKDEKNIYFLNFTVPKKNIIKINDKKIMYNEDDIVKKKRLIGELHIFLESK